MDRYLFTCSSLCVLYKLSKDLFSFFYIGKILFIGSRKMGKYTFNLNPAYFKCFFVCRQTSAEEGRQGRKDLRPSRGTVLLRGAGHAVSAGTGPARTRGSSVSPAHETGGLFQAPRAHLSAPHLLKTASLSEMEPSQAGESWLPRLRPLSLSL